MAHQWFVKRDTKQFGPFTSAQLKKLAAEGKVAPETEVRLGDEGKWTPASRVQGLFSAPPPPGASSSTLAPPPPPPVMAPPSAAPQAPPDPTASVTVRPVAGSPPVAKPMAATPLSAKPLAGVLAGAAAQPAANPPIAGKLIGAVGLTFGVLALGTCWLAMLDSRLGWTGIAVGSVGLLIALVGLVVAALQNASGLILNVAAAGAALVGLAASVVIGIQSGMFAAPAPVVVAATPLTAPSEPVAPAAEPPPEPTPEPEPPPEPVWTDANEAIEQPPLRIRITSARVEQVRLEKLMAVSREKPAPYLHVRVRIDNTSTDRIVNVPGWSGAGAVSSALGGVGELLEGSAIGNQLAGATAAATLVDDKGNVYPQIEAVRMPSAHTDLEAKPAVRPGESREKHLLFEPPLENVEYLRIELAPAGVSGSEPLRFQISREMLSGNTAAAGDDPAAS